MKKILALTSLLIALFGGVSNSWASCDEATCSMSVCHCGSDQENPGQQCAESNGSEYCNNCGSYCTGNGN